MTVLPVTPGLVLAQEVYMMTPTLVEMRQRTRQIMATSTSKPWGISWYSDRACLDFERLRMGLRGGICGHAVHLYAASADEILLLGTPGALCGHAVGFGGELGFSSDPTHAAPMWPPAAVSFEDVRENGHRFLQL